MKIIALLSWYDEPAWALTECVGSLARAGVDHVVALDGAYALLPGGRAQSTGEQAQAIMAAAQGAGLGCSMHLPQEVWFGNEIEKRTFLFTAGHLVAEPGEDWFWSIDADEVVTEALGVREALERTEHDVGEIVAEIEAIARIEGGSGLHPVRKLFRAQDGGIHLEHNHYRYVAGDGRVLWNGSQAVGPDLAIAETMHFVRIAHRAGTRSKQRWARQQRYYDRRTEHGAELVPG